MAMDLREIVAELGRSTDTFGRFIRQQAERIPDRVALKFEAETVTYGAYDARVNRLAAVLARAGLRAGEGAEIRQLIQGDVDLERGAGIVNAPHRLDKVCRQHGRFHHIA